MNKQSVRKKIGTLTITISIFLSFGYIFIHPYIVHLLEVYVSPDHNIKPGGERMMIFFYYFVVGLILAIGFSLFRSSGLKIGKFGQSILDEPVSPVTTFQPSPIFTLVVSSLLGIFLIAGKVLLTRIPTLNRILYADEYGVLDLFVPITILSSSLLLIAVIWKLRKDFTATKNPIRLSVFYRLIIILFIFIAGEEVSWGQSFFLWETPEFFSGNGQNETNIHNYFNAYFDFGYTALSLILPMVLYSAWLEFSNRASVFSRLVLPHPSLIGLGVLITFIAIRPGSDGELLEEMMAVFVLFYSLRIYGYFQKILQES